MKQIVAAAILGLSVFAMACKDSDRTLTGKIVINSGSGAQADSGAAVAVYHLQDSTKRFETFTDAGGDYRIEGVAAGRYLRIATSRTAQQTAMDFLRELVLTSKELQAMTGYDAISNMPDELKAAIAFSGDGSPAKDTSAARSAQLTRFDTIARAFIANMPPKIKTLFPQPGERAVAMQVLTVTDADAVPEEIVFE